jgi:hypothetical protein
MSNRPLLASLLAAVLLAACGGDAPTNSSPPPTPTPSPQITPIPRLPDQASVGALLRELVRAGVTIVANNADAPGAGKEPLKRINATYLGWPMTLSEFSTARALDTAESWESGTKPGRGDAPVAFAGLNLLVEWGPRTGSGPEKLSDARLAALGPLVETLHALMGPLRVRASVDIALPTPAVPPTTEPTP